MREFQSLRALYYLESARRGNSQIQSSSSGGLTQLIHELVAGTLRRHTFTSQELELLLDLERSGLRRSARSGMLRRYQRALERQASGGPNETLRLSEFIEAERRRRIPLRAAAAGLSSK